jgi:hypothetical protein
MSEGTTYPKMEARKIPTDASQMDGIRTIEQLQVMTCRQMGFPNSWKN